MRRYITSARGRDLSGCVRAHTYNYYTWAECAWVAKLKPVHTGHPMHIQRALVTSTLNAH